MESSHPGVYDFPGDEPQEDDKTPLPQGKQDEAGALIRIKLSQRARTTSKMVKQGREMKKKMRFFYAPVQKNPTPGRNPEE